MNNVGTGRRFRDSIEWISKHWGEEEFLGKWVALDGATLFDFDESRSKLESRLATSNRPDRLLFFKMGGFNEWRT